MATEVGQQGMEQLPVPFAEMPRTDQVDGLFGDGVVLQPGHRVVTIAVDGGELSGRMAKEEKVVRSHLLPNLDIGAIQGADGQGAVEGHFHVAGAGGLHAGGGDLFREVDGGVDALAQAHVEVG